VAGGLHCPFAPHVSTPFVTHCVLPGTHVPVHAPLTHAEFVHATAADQLPVVSQVCTPLPEHCVVPGTQMPEQAPDAHPNWHGESGPHAPLALHVSTALLAHCVD
jgi:hypothetical protein